MIGTYGKTHIGHGIRLGTLKSTLLGPLPQTCLDDSPFREELMHGTYMMAAGSCLGDHKAMNQIEMRV